MDKQLLDALNNLSYSLDMIAESLSKKGKSNTVTTNALQSGDFSKQIIEINTNLKNIKKDTEKILSNQNTILEIQKERNKSSNKLFGDDDPKKENMVKKGVGTILLIAGAVLAIGLAFRIVGNVDFVSVISLGMALVLISHAFVKISEAKLNTADSIATGKTLVIMSIALMASSWILSYIRPISFTQSVTAILIAGMFTVISFGIKKMVESLGENIGTFSKSILLLPILLPAIALGITLSSHILSYIEPISFTQALSAILIAGMFTAISFGIKNLVTTMGEGITTLAKSIVLLPILLPAIALGIAASSWILKTVTPISFAQAGTAILIAAMFTVMSFGLSKLIKSFDGINPATAAIATLLMPVVLVALAIAITESSKFLSDVQEIKTGQFLTSLGISILFIAFAFALKLIAPAIKDLEWSDVIKIPLMFTTLAIAIMISSNILVNAADISFQKMLKILAFSVVFAISATVLGLASYALAKIGIEKIAIGGLSMILLSTSIMLSSLILEKGTYNNHPSFMWALGTGSSLLVFGLAAFGLGTAIMTGIGAVALAAGAVGSLVVATTIAAASHILSKGKYEKYPDLGWAMGVGLSMTGFAMSMLGLGVATAFGLGRIALVAGKNAVLMIADTIVKTSFILANGKYEGGPTIAWASGIAIALGAFSPIYAMLMANGIMKIFGGGIGPEDFANAIKTVSKGIVDSAEVFNKSKVAFKGGPSKDWAEGVGTAIGAFSPVYAALMSSNFWNTKVSPEDMKNGINTITEGIIAAANKFSKNIANFDLSGVPSIEWGQRVSASIQAFSPIYKYMNDESGWFTSGKQAAEELSNGILSVINTVILVAQNFAGVDQNIWNFYPSNIWMQGVSSSIKVFISISKGLNSLTYASMFKISSVTGSIISVAKRLWNNSKYFSKSIDPNYMNNLSKNVIGYSELAKSLNKIDASSPFKSLLGLDPISQAAKGMIKIAGAYDKLATSLTKFGASLQSIDEGKVNLIRKLTGNLAILASMNKDTFSNMMQTLENKASVFGKLIDADLERNNVSVGDTTKKVVQNIVYSNNKTNDDKLDTIIGLLSQINKSTGGLDEYMESKSKNVIIKN